VLVNRAWQGAGPEASGNRQARVPRTPHMSRRLVRDPRSWIDRCRTTLSALENAKKGNAVSQMDTATGGDHDKVFQMIMASLQSQVIRAPDAFTRLLVSLVTTGVGPAPSTA
jgi:hypothetical protein